jgi:cytochrome c-type biogenesis protein
MESYYLAVLVALAGGVLSFISPCVLPLVPGYLCFATGMSFQELTENPTASRGRVLRGTIAFVFGFSTVFILLGATASAISGLLLEYKTVLSQIAGVIIIAFGLHMIGWFKIPVLTREIRSSGPHLNGEKSSAAQQVLAYTMGLAFAFGWTPCIGPILATILALAAGTDHVVAGVGLLSVYALGLGIPFILAALSVNRFLATRQSLHRHLRRIEIGAGLLLIGTGALILTGSLQALASYLLDLFPALAKLG